VTASNPTPEWKRRTKRFLALALAIISLAAIGRILPTGRWISSVVELLRGAGIGGAVLYVVLYTPGALLFVPAALFTFAGGYAYGALVGALIAIPGVALSATAVFWLTRTVLRRPVEQWLRTDPRFTVLDQLLTRFGAKAVILLRFSPISPFSILNFAFGLTGMKTAHYLLASAIGAIPGAAFYAQLGALAPHLNDLSSGRLPAGGRAQTVFLCVGLCITVGVAVWLGRMAREALATSGDVTEK